MNAAIKYKVNLSATLSALKVGDKVKIMRKDAKAERVRNAAVSVKGMRFTVNDISDIDDYCIVTRIS